MPSLRRLPIALIAFLVLDSAAGARRAGGQPQHLRALIVAAVAQAGLQPQGASWRRRLAWSALLPRVSGRLTRSDGWGEYLDLRSDRPALVDTNSYLNQRWEVRASWDLSKLVFDGRELAVARVVAARAVRRQKLIERVIGLYYQREALLRSPPPVRQSLDLQRVTAVLEGLTGTLLGPKPDEQSKR